MPRLYVQVEIDVFDHPKIRQVVEALDLPGDLGPDLVVGFLHRWWGYCARFGSEGRPPSCPRTVLTSMARTMLGQARKTVLPEIDQLLRETRLMDRYGHPWDWQDYTGALLTKRAKDADRKRTKRGLSVDADRTGASREEKSTTVLPLPLGEKGLGTSGESEATPKPITLPARRGNQLEAVQDHLRAVDEQARLRLRKGEVRRLMAELVYSYWCAKLQHPTALLDPKRERTLVKALEQNRDNLSELLYVVDGAAADTWANEEIGRHDVTVLYRDRAHIEKYLTSAKHKAGVQHAVAEKYLGNGATGAPHDD